MTPQQREQLARQTAEKIRQKLFAKSGYRSSSVSWDGDDISALILSAFAQLDAPGEAGKEDKARLLAAGWALHRVTPHDKDRQGAVRNWEQTAWSIEDAARTAPPRDKGGE